MLAGSNVGYLRISLKKSASLRWWEASRFGDEVGSVSCRPSGRPCRRYVAIAGESAFIGLSRASRLRFWAVAARRNSSLAPQGPLGGVDTYRIHRMMAARVTTAR
jgi:hypothetical protein